MIIMKLGKVIWYSRKLRYGFIKGEDGVDYFVYANSLLMDDKNWLHAGEYVNFEVEETDSRDNPIAVNVSSLDM